MISKDTGSSSNSNSATNSNSSQCKGSRDVDMEAKNNHEVDGEEEVDGVSDSEDDVDINNDHLIILLANVDGLMKKMMLFFVKERRESKAMLLECLVSRTSWC